MPKITQLGKKRARVQILVFGFQVQILGSFQHSIVWDMLVEFEMPVDNSCGCIQQPAENGELEAKRQVGTGQVDSGVTCREVLVEAKLANELV